MGVTPIYSIPFAEPTDLVRDWPDLSEDVADAVEAAIAGVPVLAGIGSNVVQTVKTDTFSTTSDTYTNVTGLSATITPSSATSKVLVIAHVNVGAGTSAAERSVHVRVNGGGADTYVGGADGSRVRSASSAVYPLVRVEAATITFLSSPGVATAVTYDVQIRRGSTSGTAYVNRSGQDSDGGDFPRTASSITLIEVAA